MIVVAVILGTGLRSLGAALWGFRLAPDTALYSAPGWSLFPSPLGRLLGTLGGSSGVVAGTVAGSMLFVVAVAAVAHELGGSARAGALFAALVPPAWWSIFPGVDALGASLILLAVYYDLRGWTRARAAACTLAVAFHFAALPFVVALLVVRAHNPRRAAVVCAALGAVGVGLLLVTPYGGSVEAIGHTPKVWEVGGVTVILSGLFFIPWAARIARAHRVHAVAFAWTVVLLVIAGVFGWPDHRTNTRYALPLVGLLAAAATVRPNALRPDRGTGL